MAPRVRRTITDAYVWPSVIGDITKWIKECPDCPLAKAKRNIKHNQYNPTQYRKPRNAYGIDFYGIAKSRNGYVGVLTVVDLYTRFVQFIPVQDTTAATAAKALVENVILSRGPFSILVSDGAKAYTGKIMQHFARTHNIHHVTTYHWPQGNAITERNHVILGEFLRLIPADKRDRWENEIPHLAFAVNMSVNSTNGFTPFELDCGYQPITPFDIKFQGKPTVEDLDPAKFLKTKVEVEITKERMQALYEIANRYAEAARMTELESLNKPSGRKITFSKGEKVIIYAPAQQSRRSRAEDSEESDDSDETTSVWKPKHSLSWRRAEILEKISNTTYSVKCDNGRILQRSVALIVRDNSKKAAQTKTVQQQKSPEATSSSDFAEGDFVAAKDNLTATEYEIAQITDVNDDGTLQLRYYGTTNVDLKKAVFKRVWETRFGTTMLQDKMPPKSEKPSPYVATEVDIELIVTKVMLTEQGKLSQKSVTALQATPLHHRVMNRLKARDVPTADTSSAEQGDNENISRKQKRQPDNISHGEKPTKIRKILRSHAKA